MRFIGLLLLAAGVFAAAQMHYLTSGTAAIVILVLFGLAVGMGRLLRLVIGVALMVRALAG